VRVLFGFVQALILFRQLRPHIVFSKGGYVSVPVALAAWLFRVPLIIHESDLTPGLANRFAARFAKVMCTTFEETIEFLSRKTQSRAVVTGMPTRENILRGDPESGRRICGFDDKSPILLIMGGSLGSAKINRIVEAILPKLIPHFQVAHLTGKGKRLNLDDYRGRYKQFEFIEEIHHFLAMSGVVVSRAGASSILEVLAARKPNILVPISAKASRGEQIENATYCQRKGVSWRLNDDDLSPDVLLSAILRMLGEHQNFRTAMDNLTVPDGTGEICRLISELATHELQISDVRTKGFHSP